MHKEVLYSLSLFILGFTLNKFVVLALLAFIFSLRFSIKAKKELEASKGKGYKLAQILYVLNSVIIAFSLFLLFSGLFYGLGINARNE